MALGVGLALFHSPVRSSVLTATVGMGAEVVDTRDPDMLAYFDYFGIDVNDWGGAMGPMDGDGGSVTASADDSVFYGGSGKSLKLEYNVSPAGSWSGFWMLVNPAGQSRDLSGYKHVTFYVRGTPGVVEHLKIQMKKTGGAASRQSAHLYIHDYLDGGVPDSWTPVSIPLDAFANLDSLTTVTEFNFVFEQAYAQSSGFSTAGVVYVDNIRFSTVSLGSVRIDHFGDGWGWGALGGNQGNMGGAGGSASFSYDLSVFSPFPRSFKSDYNVTAGWAGHWFKFGGGADGNTAVPCNLSGYRYLHLRLRALSGATNPGTLKIELQSGASNTAIITVTGITDSWQNRVVDLTSAAVVGPLDRGQLKQMNIVYDGAAVQKTGTVYFDSITLSASP